MQIEIIELKIGNYVTVNGRIAIVKCIDSLHENHIQVELPEKQILDIPVTDVKAIQLDSELLSRCCNFNSSGKHVNSNGWTEYNFKLHNGHIILKDEHEKPLIHFWNIQYLHQFQNLYYSLRKEELEVNFVDITS